MDSVFDIEFRRICLDEAHYTRSQKKFFHACNKVLAKRKWALTGTPFVNNVDDIYALMAFVGVEPFNDKEIFEQVISSPMKNGNKEVGLTCLRVSMVDASLRRSKDMDNKTVVFKEFSFDIGSPHHKVYNTLLSAKPKNMTHLRQACCSGELVKLETRQKVLKMER